jgi:hypothetical protein
MTCRSLRPLLLVAGLLVGVLFVDGGPTGATDLSPASSSDTYDLDRQAQIAGIRRVNAPYGVSAPEAAVFWFGRVTPVENSVDGRVRYNGDTLWVRVSATDRRLWYDTSASAETLTDWDSASLYLDAGGGAYRFDAQLVWWEERDDYQAAYRLEEGNWVAVTAPFKTASNWKGDVPNDDKDDRGWWVIYDVPFESLGLGGPPAQGTVWRMAAAMHDRDNGAGTRIAHQVWPETMASQEPATWGQLAFGMPSYNPPRAIPGGAVTIRQGLGGTTVVDADVGGSSVCGEPTAPDYFPAWGDLNYTGKEFLNIQNLDDIGDWPCFSKYYVTFPLDALPAEKIIITATLTLHLWGSAGEGWDSGPQSSLIQVLTVGEDWNEDVITWNNAPLAVENIGGTWVQPVSERAEDPGIPYKWDVSRAAAEAYTQGEPLRLALYEADYAYHSGKYFHSSDIGDQNTEGRPTLTITYGRAVADLNKVAAPSSGDQGTPIDYTLSFLGTGHTLTLTDTLPLGVGVPGNFELEGTSVMPAYDINQHRLMWSDNPTMGQEVAIYYAATITTGSSQVLVNAAKLSEASGEASAATATVIANPDLIYLPVILKDASGGR